LIHEFTSLCVIKGEIPLHITKWQAFKFPAFLVQVVLQIFVFLNELLGLFFRLRRVNKVFFWEINPQAFDITENVSQGNFLQVFNFIYFLILNIVLVVFKRYLRLLSRIAFIIYCSAKCMSLNQLSPIILISWQFRFFYDLRGSLVFQEFFPIVHKINHLACDPYQMLSTDKPDESLLVSLLKDCPQDIVSDGFLTSEERGHLFFA